MAPETVVVGPQGSRRIQLYMSGYVHIFNILLQPAGLNRLVGIDMTALVDEGIAARDVLGKSALLLGDAVRSATGFASRAAAAELWFGRMLERGTPQDGIDHASRLLLATRGRTRIEDLVKQSGLSARHFQRRFTSQVRSLSQTLCANHQVRHCLDGASQRTDDAVDQNCPRSRLLRSGAFHSRMPWAGWRSAKPVRRRLGEHFFPDG